MLDGRQRLSTRDPITAVSESCGIDLNGNRPRHSRSRKAPGYKTSIQFMGIATRSSQAC